MSERGFLSHAPPLRWIWMIMHHIPLHRVMGLDFIRKQAGRIQHQRKTIWCNLASTRRAWLLVRVAWVMCGERARLKACRRLSSASCSHWNGSSAEGPVSPHNYSTGFPRWIPNPSRCCSVAWLDLCGFILNALPVRLYCRWVWSKFWVLHKQMLI